MLEAVLKFRVAAYDEALHPRGYHGRWGPSHAGEPVRPRPSGIMVGDRVVVPGGEVHRVLEYRGDKAHTRSQGGLNHIFDRSQLQRPSAVKWVGDSGERANINALKTEHIKVGPGTYTGERVSGVTPAGEMVHGHAHPTGIIDASDRIHSVVHMWRKEDHHRNKVGAGGTRHG